MKHAAIALLGALGATVALAQAPDLEPGVQTSSAAQHAPVSAPVSASPAAATASPGAARAPQAPPAPAASATPEPKAAAAQSGPGTLQRTASGDRLQLETTEITGNRELPRVMYVVPWRKDDLAQYAGRPPNSLLDEALTPIDRDVFRRQAQYYDALKAGAASANSQPRAPAAPPAQRAPQDEK
jgi:hypothetical protein